MRWDARYLGRLLSRTLGRSLLSLLLAVLLAFAFGVLTVLRGIYGELYQQVEVKPKITGGITYQRADRIAESGYVRDPYYEAMLKGNLPEGYHKDWNVDLIFINDIRRLVKEDILWLEGWDESFAATDAAVCVLSAPLAEILGLELGDQPLICELEWYSHLMANIRTSKEEERIWDIRWEKRPKATIVGLIQEGSGSRVFLPAVAWRKFISIFETELLLDLAEYTLNDYHQAKEFTVYAQDQISKSSKKLKLNVDTSYADRIYKIHRLLETLYPLTIAAALLLACVLPGLTVLHGSREISILRALGAKARKCVGIYTLAQVLCAFVGLLLGFILVILIQRPDPGTVMRPFALYLLAHLAACALGSGVFAWLCARKHVLAQLQAKE